MSQDVPEWVVDFVEEWKSILRLEGWTIRVISTRLDDCYGSCLAQSAIHSAVIKIDFDEIEEHNQDPKAVLLHELVHIVFCPIQDYQDMIMSKNKKLKNSLILFDNALEQVVDRTTKALMVMYEVMEVHQALSEDEEVEDVEGIN